MTAPKSPVSPAPHAAPVRPIAPLTRLARLSPLVGASLLAAAACGASALLASGLILVLEPAGWLALPLAAALGMLVLLLPLAALLLKLARDLERSRQLLAQLDTQDTLTGVSNRAHFMALAEREWARSRRYGSGAAVLLIEVDRLRRLGEVRGAAAADAVLRELAHTIAKTLRGADALARYSSAQLAVFLAQADATGALDAAERIRENAEQLDVTWQDNRLRVTVSLGVAMLRPAHQNLQSLLADAQMALDASRHSGGNCVRAAPIDPARLPTRGPSVGDNQAAGPV